MSTKIQVPTLGESITEAIVARWIKSVGDTVQADEALVELETDKITVEVPAPGSGTLTAQLFEEGDNVKVGDAIAELLEGEAAAAAPAATPAPAPAPTPAPAPAPAPAPVAAAPAPTPAPEAAPAAAASGGALGTAAPPSARAEAQRRGIDIDTIKGSGRGGRVQKSDVLEAASHKAPAAPAPAPAPAPAGAKAGERVVPMTPLRKRIAQRLVQAQADAAILTTFNEVDMSAVMNLRKQFKDGFLEKHETKLGFMSFFAKACVSALKAFPAVNAEIRGDDIVYKDFYDIGIAVGGGKGLVVPVVRGVDNLSFAQIEGEIVRLAGLAKKNRLQISDLSGGTFTISNGGIYGSMLSTPILNPPQTGILGLHNIQQRPVAVDGKVEIRPMMYLALSYDHRLVDGREAVQFLIRIKDCIEDPRRLLLDI